MEVAYTFSIHVANPRLQRSTSIRVTEAVRSALEEYKRRHNLSSMNQAIVHLLASAEGQQARIVELMERQVQLLAELCSRVERQNRLLETLEEKISKLCKLYSEGRLYVTKAEESDNEGEARVLQTASINDSGLPSFARGNPWLEVLSARGR